MDIINGPVLAYLDPGSGSAIVSAIVAAIAAVGVTIKLYWHRLLRLLGLKKKKPVEQAIEATDADVELGRR